MNGIKQHERLQYDQAVEGGNLSDMGMPNTPVSKGSNGVNGRVNGQTTNGVQDRQLQNGNIKTAEYTSDLPPEVRHITETMVPLGSLISRQAQECWNGLSELVNELADLPVSTVSSQPNGVGGRVIPQPGMPWGDMSEANLQKKERILKWAHDQRAFFIKLMVLSGWSRTMPEMHKAIDMSNWLREQLFYYDNACDLMGFMRRDLVFAQIPNPDLKTAIEVLATGRSLSFPDLGYTEPKPLSPEKTLKTLRHINSIICSRLALDDDIPLAFQIYDIHDGRVTFTVPSEFSLDLSVADEDPNSQFYFVAFRFLFAPCSNIPEGRLFEETQARINDVLKRDGLQGCYDFFHDLTLSYKLNILFKQALEMSRSQWSEQLRVEMIHRTLVVQYWPNRAAGKSWIEIGIKSGRRKDSSSRSLGPGICYLDLKWKRENVEEKTSAILFDMDVLSLERTLRSITALHTSLCLDSIYDQLIAYPIYANGELSLEVSSSSRDTDECYLALQVTRTRTLTVKMEPISGNLLFQPTSQRLMREELTLNRSRDQIGDAAARLALLRCLIADQDLATIASSAGWEHLTSFKPSQTDLRQMFPKSTLKQSFFKLPGWGARWILAVTHSMAGDQWWLVDLSGAPKVEPLDTQPIHYVATLSYSYFTALQEYVSGIIALKVNRAAQQGFGITCTAELPRKFVGHVQPVEMHFEVPSSFVQPGTHEKQSMPAGSLANQILVKTSGYDQTTGKIQFQAHVKCAMPTEARQLLSSNGASSLRSSFKDGVFVLEYVLPVTESLTGKLVDDLRRLNRLVTYSTILATQRNILVVHISLSCLAIVYHQNPHARLLLKFPTEVVGPRSSTLVLTLNPGNPHERIKHHLHNILSNSQRASATNLSAVLRILGVTFPLLSILSEIQTRSMSESMSSPTVKSRFHVLTTSPTQYTLHFVAPCPALDISIAHHHRKNKDLWIIRLAKPGHKSHNQSNGSESSIRLRSEVLETVFKVQDAGASKNAQDPWIRMDQGAIVQVMDSNAIKLLFEKIIAVTDRASISAPTTNSEQKDSIKQQNGNHETKLGSKGANRLSQGKEPKSTSGAGNSSTIRKGPPANSTKRSQQSETREVITLD
ncbi:putative rna polymerase ii holoenzyme mediator complex component [Phaeomoniella chlamydospora]|uniref:Mediator of RNA polymerase II transcription subunit 14 n=1 Tax=Phaeomoniella chlamydospora TaxID=158046 RepID=A0A0G2G581_PHACM|nr:putative rna polymerase ii holoenzyme mediator complex component [Phaeomoniella chlamydospora]